MILISDSVEKLCLLTYCKIWKSTKQASVLYPVKNLNYYFYFLTVGWWWHHRHRPKILNYTCFV